MIERSKEWWVEKARAEGSSAVSAGGDSGMTPEQRETARKTLLAYGWSETIYGTFQAPGEPWYGKVWRLEAAYARVTGKTRVT
jgi:hypothetical protein